jgi:hypothetical protein
MEHGIGQTNGFGPTPMRDRVNRIQITTSEMEFMYIKFC